MCKTNIKTKIVLLTGAMTVVVLFSFFSLAQASTITAEKVVDLVNKERIKEGLSVLVLSKALSQAAEDKVRDMIKNDYFAHNSPAGLTPWHWIEKNGYDYKYAGENLAVGFESVEKQQDAWMKSESHRKNILNVNYRDIGVAVREGKINGESTLLAVQLFGAPRLVSVAEKEDSPALKPEPETAVLPAEVASPEVPQTENITGQNQPASEIKKEVAPVFSKSGNLLEAGRQAAIILLYLVLLVNPLILMSKALPAMKLLLSPGKTGKNRERQILCTVSAEEYEDLMRNFKTRTRGMYKAHFNKIYLKMPS